MKAITFLTLALLMLNFGTACSSNASNASETKTAALKADNVEVYYFHNARRCTTCKAVEAESKNAVKELYGDKISFAAYNLEEAKGEQKAKKLGVSGQTLLIVSGDTKINITNEGFMYARNNPEKLKQIIKSKIDPLIN